MSVNSLEIKGAHKGTYDNCLHPNQQFFNQADKRKDGNKIIITMDYGNYFAASKGIDKNYAKMLAFKIYEYDQIKSGTYSPHEAELVRLAMGVEIPTAYKMYEVKVVIAHKFNELARNSSKPNQETDFAQGITKDLMIGFFKLKNQFDDLLNNSNQVKDNKSIKVETQDYSNMLGVGGMIAGGA